MRRLFTKRRVLIFVPVALLLAAFLSIWLLWIGPGPSGQDTTLIVAEGSSVTRVADQLAEQGLVRGGINRVVLVLR